VTLRPTEPEDKPLLAAMVEGLSEELSYWRCFTSKTELSPAELDSLVDVDPFAHEAIIAIDVSSGEARGVARCSRSNDDAEVAEVAVIVADDRQGRGLGRALLDSRHIARGERAYSGLRARQDQQPGHPQAGRGGRRDPARLDTGEVELVIEVPPTENRRAACPGVMSSSLWNPDPSADLTASPSA
jgi:GNAT superfamily N-acetyltransferase